MPQMKATARDLEFVTEAEATAARHKRLEEEWEQREAGQQASSGDKQNEPAGTCSGGPTDPEGLQLEPDALEIVSNLVDQTEQESLVTPDNATSACEENQNIIDNSEPRIHDAETPTDTAGPSQLTEIGGEVSVANIAGPSRVSDPDTTDNEQLVILAEAHTQCRTCKKTLTAAEKATCKTCGMSQCLKCEKLTAKTFTYVVHFVCLKCESKSKFDFTKWKITTPNHIVEHRVRHRGELRRKNPGAGGQQSKKKKKSTKRLGRGGSSSMTIHVSKCSGCKSERNSGFHQECLACQQTRCPKCERLQPGDEQKIERFYCLKCEDESKDKATPYKTQWVGTKATPSQVKETRKDHFTIKEIIDDDWENQNGVYVRIFQVLWEDGTTGWEWEESFDDAVDMLNDYLRKKGKRLTKVQYLIGSTEPGANPKELVPVSDAISKLRHEQKIAKLDFIPVMDWPDLAKDQVFIYPYELHGYAGLYVKEHNLVMLGDGSNHLKKNAELCREIARNLLKPDMGLVLMDVPNEDKKNYCASDAVAIALCLIRKYRNQDWSPRITISNRLKERSRSIQPIEQASVGEKGGNLRHYKCQYCAKPFPNKKRINSMIVTHEIRCPANLNKKK